MATRIFGDEDGEVTASIQRLAGNRRSFVRVEGAHNAQSEPTIRTQPSPTGDDSDLLMKSPPKPRMIGGSASAGWAPKIGEDPRGEVE